MEELEVKEDTRRNKIMKHIRENRKMYIKGTTCFVAGVTVTLVYCLVTDKFAKITINNITNEIVKNTIDGNDNSIFIKRTSPYGVPLGRHGTPVRNLTTGKEYDNMTNAAQHMGVDYNLFRDRIKQGLPINGQPFELVVE